MAGSRPNTSTVLSPDPCPSKQGGVTLPFLSQSLWSEGGLPQSQISVTRVGRRVARGSLFVRGEDPESTDRSRVLDLETGVMNGNISCFNVRKTGRLSRPPEHPSSLGHG